MKRLKRVRVAETKSELVYCHQSLYMVIILMTNRLWSAFIVSIIYAMGQTMSIVVSRRCWSRSHSLKLQLCNDLWVEQESYEYMLWHLPKLQPRMEIRLAIELAIDWNLRSVKFRIKIKLSINHQKSLKKTFSYLDQFWWISIIKWQATKDHGIQDTSCCPYVGHEWIVWNSFENLRACISIRSAIGFRDSWVFSSLFRCRWLICFSCCTYYFSEVSFGSFGCLWNRFEASGESKVNELHNHVLIKQNIFTLDVSMSYTSLMAIFETSDDLTKEFASKRFRQTSLFMNQLEYRTVWSMLHHNVESGEGNVKECF